MSWRAFAECRRLVEAGEASSDWWFPDKCDFKTGQLAKSICASCPVKQECAIEGARQDGIWGGLNTTERRGLADQHRRCSRCQVPIPGRVVYCGSCALQVRRETKARSNTQRRLARSYDDIESQPYGYNGGVEQIGPRTAQTAGGLDGPTPEVAPVVNLQ